MKKTIIIIIILAIIAGVGFFVYSKSTTKETVKTYMPEKRDMQEVVEETGAVRSYGERKIYSKVQAKPITISFDIGDAVKKGDVLIKFDETAIDSQIAMANAQLAQVRANYKETTKPADKERIQIIKSNIKNIEIQIADMQKTVDKNINLYNQGAISSAEKEQAENQLATLRNQLASAQNELTLLEKGASTNVRAGFEAQIAEIQASIKSLQDQKVDYTVLSPIDGVVTEKLIEEDGISSPGMELMDVSTTGDLYIEADILVSELKGLNEGDKAIVYNEDLDINIENCIVSKVYPTAHTKVSDLGIEQKRVTIEIDLGDGKDQIKQGYDVDVKIIKNVKTGVIAIKEADVYDIDEEKYVDVYENDKVKRQNIKTGITEGDYVEVTEGLTGNEKIVELDKEKSK